jgi:hypothetical protein
MEGTENEHNILVQNPQGTGLTGSLNTDGMKILKWTKRKTGLEGTDWIQLA